MESEDTEMVISVCKFCEGTGVFSKNGAIILCPDCSGKGYLRIKAKILSRPPFHKDGESKEVCYQRLRREVKQERELYK